MNSRRCAQPIRAVAVFGVPLGFLSSYFSFEHTAPEAFRTTPVLLTHPADDRWTPPELSLQFLRRINAPTEFVMLDGCGHFPVEEPGLTQFHDAVDTLLRSVAERHRTKTVATRLA